MNGGAKFDLVFRVVFSSFVYGNEKFNPSFANLAPKLKFWKMSQFFFVCLWWEVFLRGFINIFWALVTKSQKCVLFIPKSQVLFIFSFQKFVISCKKMTMNGAISWDMVNPEEITWFRIYPKAKILLNSQNHRSNQFANYF